jgi:cell division septation protein DedD
MRGVFDEQGVEEAAPRRDTELTLGSFTLLLIFFGLVLLCGLCFGMGYSLGHRESQGSPPGPVAASDTRTSTFGDNAHAKPFANAQGGSGSQPNAAASPQASAPPSASSTSAHTSLVSAQIGSSNQTGLLNLPSPSAQSVQVKPAFGAAANPIQTTQPASSAVGPAMASGALMVQIAAVSQTEDADVLMSALRKRGYAVGAHREPLDGLIHVRIGPFKTRDEADTWRQKLLNDGYNAIVQP